MSLETLFQRLSASLQPDRETQNRAKQVLMASIEEPAVLKSLARELSPRAGEQDRVWARIQDRISSPRVETVFEKLRDQLLNAETDFAPLRMPQLAPVRIPITHQPIFRWVAACMLVAVVIRSLPLIFIAPSTAAESPVFLIPTEPGLELSSHGLWQSVAQQLELKEADVTLRTGDGEATLMLHDDGNIRFDRGTIATVLDLSDLPTTESVAPTLALQSGQIWVQGLLPSSVDGMRISTPQGTISVNGGSVSIAVNADRVTVAVWDRHAAVQHDGERIALVAGEQLTLSTDRDPKVRGIDPHDETLPWVTQNLTRDAVHQREIAQLQQERRAATAGILPTSPLYPVKRAAESLDLLLTLDPETRVQKQLQQASTRLDEAAALIASGESGALVSIQEYKDTLLSVASGSGGNAVVQQLINEELSQNTAELAAALPDDSGYVLKKAVLEASAQVPNDPIEAIDVHGTLVVDALDALKASIAANDTSGVNAALIQLSPYLDGLQGNATTTLRPEVRKEAISLLTTLAEDLRLQSDANLALTPDLSRQLAVFVPKEPRTAESLIPALTEEEIDRAVQDSLDRIFFTYKMETGRANALRAEIITFRKNHPQDEGSYLRKIYDALPMTEEYQYLIVIVRRQIQLLREKQLSEQTDNHAAASEESSSSMSETDLSAPTE